MKTIFRLFMKDVRVLLNDRVAAILAFLVPMALILLFGFVLGGTSGGPSGVRLLVVDHARSAAAARLLAALEEETAFRVMYQQREEDGSSVPLTEETARTLLATNASAYRFAVIIPEDFAEAAFGFRLRFLNNPQNPMENAMVTGLLQRAFFTELPGFLVADLDDRVADTLGEDGWETLRRNIGEFGVDVFGVDPETTLEGFDDFVESVRGGTASLFQGSTEREVGEAGLFGGLLDLESEQVFGRGRNMATQSIAGFAAMFLLFGLTAAATSFFEERNQQILHRLLAGPVTRGQILAGKYLFSVVFGFTQVAVLFVFGHLVFDVVARPGQVPLLAFVTLALSAAATGFGMILCAFTRTAAQAQGVATLLILTMSALGGAMIPAFLFPPFLREFISPLSPVYWGVEGFLAVLWRDAGFAEVWPYAGVLLLFAAVTLAVATPRFLRDGTFSR